MRKYLDDIGVSNRPDTWNLYDERQYKWFEERKTYGFDERETWALGYSFHLWLYERLKRYLEVAQIDLEYCKFNYNGNTYTQKQMIEMMIERLEFSFTDKYCDSDSKQCNYVSEIEKIWAEVVPVMWW